MWREHFEEEFFIQLSQLFFSRGGQAGPPHVVAHLRVGYRQVENVDSRRDAVGFGLVAEGAEAEAPAAHLLAVPVVDDEQGLLMGLGMALGEGFRFVPCETVGKAREALRAGARPTSDDGAPAVFGNPLDGERFSRAAVMLVDYGLSGMTGLDLVREFHDHPALRILYSGMSDVDCVEEALREGMLDRFIAKHDPNFLERLEASVEELAWRFFIQRGREVLESPGELLGSPGVARLLADLRERFGCVEHYLYRDFSGFLLVDEEGEAFRLAVGRELAEEEAVESGEVDGDEELEWRLAGLPAPFGDESIVPFSSLFDDEEW